MRRPVVLHRDDAEPTIGELHDYSAAGVGLTIDIELKAGQEFTINLIMPDGATVPLKFEVVHAQAESDERFSIGARRIVPEVQESKPVEVPVKITSGSEAFDTRAARGFARAQTLDGTTVCGWERQLDLRREGEKLWLNMHPPGKSTGWGMYVNRTELLEAIDSLIDGEVGAFKLSA